MMIALALACILIQRIDAAITILNKTDYDRMPPIVKMDPYEPCIRQPNALYCNVKLTWVSDTPSPLLDMIHEYSEHTATRYNHTKMKYFMCVSQNCEKYYNNTLVDLRTSLEACLNDSLWRTYQLKARVSDELTCNSHTKMLEVGVGDAIIAVICLTILITNVMATYLDYYYSTEEKSKGLQLLLCFSIICNWRKFANSAVEDLDPRLNNFQGLHGIRVITTCLMIAVHSMLPLLLLCENTQFIEEVYLNPGIKIILNGTLIMQTFLMISSMLSIYKAQMYAEKHKISWTVLPKLFALRWWRITPPYALTLGLTATWLRFTTSGPFWQELVGDEAQDCRRYWWLHILYINNYFDHSRCMPQIWYLATDIQLYCVGLVVFVLCKSYRAKKIGLGLLLAAAVIAPAMHTYIEDLDPVLINKPEAIMSQFMNDKVFDHIYKRAHTNLAGCVVGLCIGYLVYHMQQSNFNSKEIRNYRFFYWTSFPLAVGVVYTGNIFYSDRPRDPALVRALYAGLLRPIFAGLIGTVILGTILQVEAFYRGILEWKLWRYLSRLTFSAYLWHIAYIRNYTALHKTTIHANFTETGIIAVKTLIMTFTFALIFWLLVEAPLGNILKLIYKKDLDKPKAGQKEKKKTL